MHPLHNGSQATERPAAKPLTGTPGWFTESGDNNVPSYPGADWFNKNIAEFLNALTEMSIEFDPTKDDHLQRAFSAVTNIQLYIQNLNDALIATDIGRVGIGTTEPAAKLHVKVVDDDTCGIRSTCSWSGTTEAPFQNNDCSLYEVFNDVKSNSFNQSWGASCANAYNNIPTGVADDGQRVGVYGWAVSTPVVGYVHRGLLEFQLGVMGVAGFLGEGTPAGAVINNAVGVRGRIVNDSAGADILNARAGEFISDSSVGNVNNNWGVYALAENGNVNRGVYAKAAGGLANYSFFGDGGNFWQKDKAYFGSEVSQSNAPVAARGLSNSYEFGNQDAGGYGSTLGATYASGFPFMALCAEADKSGNTFTTRGKKGVVVYNDLNGAMVFARLPNENESEQEPVECGRFTDEGFLKLSTVPTYASNAAAVTAGELLGTFYKTATGELRIVI